MKPLLIAGCIAASLAGACAKNIDDHGSDHVDFSNPKRVVSAIFYAAQKGVSLHLAGLCDPLGEANVHAKRICSQTLEGADWPAFVKQFAKGKLIGEARIAEGRALVNFVFGESGTDPETMELVQRDGRWYLLSF